MKWILTWIYCGKVYIVYSSSDVKLIQSKRSSLKKEQQYKKGYFEVRTEKGLQIKPILKIK